MKKAIKYIIIAGILVFAAIAFSKYYGFINDFNNFDNKENIQDEFISDDDIKNSLFKEYYEQARKTVTNMTLEEKVGQLFLVRYRQADVEYLSNFNPGGYILFARDFENHTKEQMKDEITTDQKLNKYGLIMGVDEEGGFVTRVSRFPAFRSEKFKSPRAYYDEGGYQLLEQTENEKAKILKEIGINLNLAPVADISTNPDDFINNRAFGYDATKTSEFVKNMVTYANNNKINSCLKHFPGYGNNVDTHTGIAIDERNYDNFVNNDYLPFKAGIEANVPSVLISHNVVKSIDENYPASLSKDMVNELRNKLGFTGIIMTDDLAMDAVKSYVEDGHAATLAIQAGNDMIITSDFMAMYKEVINSVNEGILSEEQINKAVLRIIAWKYYSNILK